MRDPWDDDDTVDPYDDEAPKPADLADATMPSEAPVEPPKRPRARKATSTASKRARKATGGQ